MRKDAELENTDYPEEPVFINGIEIPPHLIRTTERLSKIEQVSLLRQNDLTIVLENVHDAHNISACIRSCDAVGIKDIHVVNTMAPRPYKRLGKKTSGGSIRWVKVHKWKSLESCFNYLHSKGFKIFTTSLTEDSKSLYELDLTEKTALIFGNEHDGVSKEASDLADGNYIIPQIGMIESLNISVACAVSLYEAKRQKQLKGHYDKSRLPKEEFKEMLYYMLER